MKYQNYSTRQLIKYSTILLILGILALVTMCIVLGITMYRIANDIDSILIYIVPTILGPMAIFPLLISAGFKSEIKEREKKTP